MKTVLSWFRWKYLVPLLIVVGAIIVFFVVFFDPILERGLEKAGGKINGAKVDVDGLKTTFSSGRLSIERLQVADKDAPFQNSVEAGPLVFQLNLGELFSKRVIINEATLKGLAFETKRKTSGALPKHVMKRVDKESDPGVASRLVDKYKDQFKLNIDGLKGEVNKRIEFDTDELELVKAAEALKAQSEQLPDQWKSRVAELNVEARLKQAESDLVALKNTPTKGSEALTAIPAALQKANAVKADLEKLKKEVEQTKVTALSDIKQVRSGIAGLSAAKERDIANLKSRLNLDFLNPDRLVEGLIGPMLVQRVKTALHYVDVVRKNMPSKKERDALPPKPRAKGMDILFPTPAAPPAFWLMQAALEGAYHGVAATGSLSHLTSDPSKVGKPFELKLHGAESGRVFTAKGMFDHTTDVSRDALWLSATGLDAASLFGVEGDRPEFSQGQARISLDLGLMGDNNINGNVVMGLSNLKFENDTLLKKIGIDSSSSLSAEDKLKSDFIMNVARSIEAMKEVNVSASLSGTWQDPDMKIGSNLGPVLSNVIKASIGNAFAEQRRELESRLNTILAEKTGDLTKNISGLEGGVNTQVAAIQSKIQSKISEASGLTFSGSNGATGIKLPSLDKLFKK